LAWQVKNSSALKIARFRSAISIIFSRPCLDPGHRGPMPG
jgi:hypothetical protein